MRYLVFLLLCFSLSFTSFDVEARRGGFGDGYHVSIKKQKTYQTYKKINKKTGKVYVGRTSGANSPAANIRNRDRNHHRNKDGFAPAKIDKSSTNMSAIRGREQQEIDKHRKEGNAADQINGISPKNIKREYYLREANKEFGS